MCQVEYRYYTLFFPKKQPPILRIKASLGKIGAALGKIRAALGQNKGCPGAKEIYRNLL